MWVTRFIFDLEPTDGLHQEVSALVSGTDNQYLSWSVFWWPCLGHRRRSRGDTGDRSPWFQIQGDNSPHFSGKTACKKLHYMVANNYKWFNEFANTARIQCNRVIWSRTVVRPSPRCSSIPRVGYSMDLCINTPVQRSMATGCQPWCLRAAYRLLLLLRQWCVRER